jgi:iron(III) transport system substrate-binding protein
MAAAKSEGKLTAYSAYAPAATAALAAAFKKDHPEIALTMVAVSSPDQATKIEAERAGNVAGADVSLTTNGPWLLGEATGDFFAEIVGPNATTGVAVQRKLLSGRNRILNMAAAPQGFGWNKKLITKDLAFNDLFDPAYKGKLGLLEYKASDTYAMQMYLYAQENGGDAFLQKLAALEPRYYSTSVPMAQAMGAGEVTVAFQLTSNVIGNLPLAFKYPSPTFASPYYSAISGGAKHPNAAQVFVDWLLTKSAQETYVSQGSVSMMDLVPDAPVKPDNIKLNLLQNYTAKFIADYVTHLNEILKH